MLNFYLEGALLVFIYMTIWFLICQWRKDNSLVDVAWGFGFVLLAGWGYVHSATPGYLILFLMVGLWGIRLTAYLLLRNVKKGEDWRYVKMKADWGKNYAWNAFTKVFMLQGGFMWIIALPIFQTNYNPSYFIQGFGFTLWLAGFLWEAIADWQLYLFKQQPENKGKIMTKGLWKYSRHPNYFGEIVLWWGIFIFTYSYAGLWPIILSPITISWLLIKVSGVPMLEKKYRDNPDYQQYKQSTNALFPNFFTRMQ